MASIIGQDVPSGFVPPAQYGVWGDSGDGYGVIGSSTLPGTPQPPEDPLPGGIGVLGVNDQFYGTGVQGSAIGESGIGVAGIAQTGNGVDGSSAEGIGVVGTGGSVGVEGIGSAVGVTGRGNNYGVGAFNGHNSNAAYLASDCCAGYFVGPVAVYGTLSKSGGGFLIDHPIHPAERFLAHSFVESSEMKNIYDGVTELNSGGEALVELPEWFTALNDDLRYQLTALGAASPNLHIAMEVTDNKFRIAGGVPGARVCWQVTGIRQDAWARANPLVVDEEKPAGERDHYLNPEVHGQPIERAIAFVRHPAVAQPPTRPRR